METSLSNIICVLFFFYYAVSYFQCKTVCGIMEAIRASLIVFTVKWDLAIDMGMPVRAHAIGTPGLYSG
jgi:hypothetical protein